MITHLIKKYYQESIMFIQKRVNNINYILQDWVLQPIAYE